MNDSPKENLPVPGVGHMMVEVPETIALKIRGNTRTGKVEIEGPIFLKNIVLHILTGAMDVVVDWTPAAQPKTAVEILKPVNAMKC